MGLRGAHHVRFTPLGDPPETPKSRIDLGGLAGARSCLSQGVDLSGAFPGCGTDDPAALETVACRVCVAFNQADDLALGCDVVDDGVENASCL